MNDNKTARKKLEQMEKARKMEEERRERIKAQRNRGVDTSDREFRMQIWIQLIY